jgi:hypothetical protein
MTARRIYRRQQRMPLSLRLLPWAYFLLMGWAMGRICQGGV